MDRVEYFSPYINYDVCDNGAYSTTTQDHSRLQRYPRQNHNSHDSWRHSYHSSTSDPIFKDYSSSCSSQPQSVAPTLILDPFYETVPGISLERDHVPVQTTSNYCYPTPRRGISPSSSDSSVHSMDSWLLPSMSSMSSPASSISSRHASPIPEPRPHPSTRTSKASHLSVQAGLASIRPSIVSPRHAKRATPYPNSSEDGADGKPRWACPDCGKKFTRDSDRKRHCDESTSCHKKTMKSYDESDGIPRFECEYCQRLFSRQDSLERHRKNPTACIARPKARH